ncbi:hypothetical protein FH972_010358 [Carpinus fangiana]|uniref:Uncharacterized protein n=1 Tax=Carpinus fangiana TaxID=176857 RepID=A0A660KPZ8_9ROSI|nr:hypothetical protein FH972_010358 [Carpinus fangiana]
MGDISISDMTDLVVPDIDCPGVGVGVGAEKAGPIVAVGAGVGAVKAWPIVAVGAGAGAEKAGPIVAVGAGTEKDWPIVAVGSWEWLSGRTGLVKRGSGGRPREFGVDGDRVGIPSAMPMSLLLASMGDYAATTRGGEFTTHEVTVEAGEGRFKIVLLTGSYRASGTGSYTSFETGWDDVPRIDGHLKIALVEGDGPEFFGGVAGVLIAAEPVQARSRMRSRMRRVSNLGRVPGVRNSGRVPGVRISEMTGGDDGDTCTTPSSTTSMEAVHGGADLGGVCGVHISKMTGGGDDDTCTTPSSTATTASPSLFHDNYFYTEVD